MGHCKDCEKPCMGCQKPVDAKCVLYNGQCLDVIEYCAGTNMELIIIKIDELLREILEVLDRDVQLLSIGTGAKVYKGQALDIHRFRSILGSDSIDVDELDAEIRISVDTDWLDGYMDTLSSLDGSITITPSTGNKDLAINPSVFEPLDGTMDIQASLPGGQRKIKFGSKSVSVGSGVKVYKGIGASGHEYRSVTTELVKPVNPGQLNGTSTIAFTATEDGDNIKIKLDLKDLEVAVPINTGVQSYYVNSGGDDATATGSIIKPYKTWAACKAAIIGGGGSSGNPAHPNSTVIFQTDQTSSEDLSVKNTTYQFENNSVFTYIGSNFVVDTDNIHTGSNGYYFVRFAGTGEVRVMDTSKAIRINCQPGGNPNINVNVTHLTGSNITWTEYFNENKFGDSGTLFTRSGAIAGVSGDLTDSGTSTVIYGATDAQLKTYYGQSGNEPEFGFVTILGGNSPVEESMTVQIGGTMTIRAGIQCPLFIKNGTMVSYGNIMFDYALARPGKRPVRYSTATSSTLNPSAYCSQVLLDSNSSGEKARLLVSGAGTASGFLLGSIVHGGFKSTFELKGYNSAFESSSSNTVTWNGRSPSNYLVYFSGADGGSSSSDGKQFRAVDIYTRLFPKSGKIFYGGADYGDIKINLEGGSLESFSSANPPADTFGGSLVEANISFSSKFLSVLSIPRTTNLPGNDTNLLKGQWYNDSGTLKIKI